MKNYFDVDGNLWIRKNDKAFIGKGRIELLENIQIYGSISKAAKVMKMSYKAAWDSVDIMNKLATKPLVTKVSGGKGGGGTIITTHAKELILAYKEIEALHKNYLDTLANSFNENVSNQSLEEPAFSRLSGVISHIKEVNENCEITIELSNNQKLTSIENKRFIKEKALEIGKNIHLLIESSNIVLNKTAPTNSARNVLCGTISQIHNDEINANITLTCDDANTLNAKITASSCEKLSLQMNDKVYASFKAYNINII